MDSESFRKRGRDMIDYICTYLGEIGERRVTPSVEPGYLRRLIPDDPPEHPETWEDIMNDVETKIMPGVTHWQHPRFHAYFPSGNSFPSILGDMLSDAIGCIGFSWAASPACTELETIVLDWFGKAIGLPDDFLAFKEGGKGGGVIQTSASECILVSMLAARAQALKRLKQQHPFVEEGLLLSKLMAYCSKQAHSSVEKAAMISFVKMRILEPDENSSLRGKTLLMAMEEDERMGMIPFFVSVTLGTTACCSFDNLAEIGPVCQRFACIWLHVDAAYAGNSFICPELRQYMAGVEYADSFNTNPNKWLMTCFDCSCMWVKDKIKLTSALVVDPLYLQHGYSKTTIDYRHWGVPLSRRFRSLKLWFVMRTFGISGLRKYIRLHINLAKKFEELVRKDARFEICNSVKLGLVCFRLKGDDQLNEKLLSNINESGKLHMVPARVKDKYVIRFCVTAQNATEEEIYEAWSIIKEYAQELFDRPSGLEKDQELQDQITDLQQRKRAHTLAQKRSFFVRMVSDPKIYNPSVAKAMPSTRRGLTEEATLSPENVNADLPVSSSWISWPLSFLFQSGTAEDSVGGSNVPLRFRHLDTTVRLHPGSNKGCNGRQSPSPERDSTTTNKSPKKTPMLCRKNNVSPVHDD